MKVLVDTSVWVDFFNEYPSREAEALARLLDDEVEILTCGVVIAEFFQGIRRVDTLPELESHFRDMECLVPREPDTYFAAAALYRDLRARGITIRSTIDCLIVCLTEEHSALLLAKDRDIAQILDSGLTGVRGVPA
ncbi:MAG: PIN domain nuclease [bacterium]|nr:PIN domain nuclease [bacterium]